MDMEINESGREEGTAEFDDFLAGLRLQSAARDFDDFSVRDAHRAIAVDGVVKNDAAAAKNHSRCQDGLFS
jgi:hypothetical protein